MYRDLFYFVGRSRGQSLLSEGQALCFRIGIPDLSLSRGSGQGGGGSTDPDYFIGRGSRNPRDFRDSRNSRGLVLRLAVFDGPESFNNPRLSTIYRRPIPGGPSPAACPWRTLLGGPSPADSSRRLLSGGFTLAAPLRRPPPGGPPVLFSPRRPQRPPVSWQARQPVSR